jgi:hypothetical protein
VLDQCKKTGKGEYVVTKRWGGAYTSEGFRAVWQRAMVMWEDAATIKSHFGIALDWSAVGLD